jgi:hypothetical protein
MDHGRRWKEILGSSLVFVILFAALTTLRVWNVEPDTRVQSAIIKGVALLCIVGVAYYTFHSGDFIGGWMLALAPSLAFTVNLFVPVVAEVTLLVVIIPLVSAAAISSAIAVIGYALSEALVFVETVLTS